MSYRVVSEEDDHFVIHDGQKEFALQKARLRHSTVQRIQKFSKGGPVLDPDEAEGGTSDADLQAVKYAQEDLRNKQMQGGAADQRSFTEQATAALRSIQDPAYVARQQAAEAPATQGPGMLERPPEETPPAPTAPLAAPAPKTPGEPNYQGQMQRASNDAIQATQQAGAVRQAGLAGEAKMQQAHADHLAQMQAASQKMMADRAAYTDKLFNDVASDKIDPNRYYETRSTGQKIGGAISMILGGLGSGLTGQPNAALLIIQKQIDRDIESQRLNMGKKENLLGRYMQQTGDLQAAQHMAQADYMTTAAAQLAAEHARVGSALAAPETQATIAQLRAGAVAATQLAVQRSIQIQEGKTNLAVQQQHAQALGQLMKGMSGGGGFDRRILEQPGFEHYRERAVDLPDGSVAFANDKEDAHKAAEGYQSVGRFKAKLQRYTELLKSGNPATTDRGSAKEMRADLLAEMGHLHDLNRLTDVDLELFKDQVPDLTDFIKPMAAQKLRGLAKSVDDKVWERNRSLLHLPASSRPKAGG